MALKRPPMPKGVPFAPATKSSAFAGAVKYSPPSRAVTAPTVLGRSLRPPQAGMIGTTGLQATRLLASASPSSTLARSSSAATGARSSLPDGVLALTPGIESQLDLMAQQMPWMASIVDLQKKALRSGSGANDVDDIFLKALASAQKIARIG